MAEDKGQQMKKRLVYPLFQFCCKAYHQLTQMNYFFLSIWGVCGQRLSRSPVEVFLL